MKVPSLARQLALLFALTVLLSACGKGEKPVTPQVDAVPLKTIAQQDREIAERLAAQKAGLESKSVTATASEDRGQFVAALTDKLAKWRQLYTATSGKTRDDLKTMLPSLAAVRSELAAIDTNACTLPLRDAASAAMGAASSAFDEFVAASGGASPEVMRKLSAAYTEVDRVDADLAGCR
jgi:hypothetical protein